MVKIRLTRQGAKKRPFYRIVAMDERLPREGRPLEFLGALNDSLEGILNIKNKSLEPKPEESKTAPPIPDP